MLVVGTSDSQGFSLEKAQRFKDKYHITDRCYRAIRMHINKDLPGVKRLRSHREYLKNKFKMKQNKYGYFNDVKTKEETTLEKVSNGILHTFATVDEEIGDKQVFTLKFAGDGTSVSRNVKVFNFVFSCINETSKCESASGHYTLGVFSIDHEEKNLLRELGV